MVTPELLAFIKNEEAKGVSRETIIKLLHTQDWTDADIIEAFNSLPVSLQPNVGSVVPQTEPFVHHRPNKKVFLVSIIAIFVLLVGGTLVYASGAFVSLDKVFSKSIESSKNTTGTSFDIHTTIDASGLKSFESESELGMSKISTFDMNTSYDIIDPENIKAVSSLSFKSGSLELGLDFRALDGSFYLNMTKAPNLGFFSLEPFENKWIVLPSDLKELAKNPLTSSMGTDVEGFSTLTDEQKKHISDLTTNASFIKITKKHLPEMINGSLSYHFDFEFDRAGLITYIKELTLYMASLNKGDMTFVPDDQEYNKMFDSIKNFHGEAWIGIFDHLPHKVLVSADISNPDMPSDGVVKVMTDITYKDWNKPVTVEAPKETTTIEQLMSSIMGGSVDMMAEPDLNDATPVPGGSSDSLTNARIKGTEAKIKSLLASMRAQAEIFYDSNSNSYKGFCTSRGQNGAYTLAVQLPNNTNYKCYDSNTSWAAGAQLIEKGYYCVDSTGFSDDTNSIAKSTSCK